MPILSFFKYQSKLMNFFWSLSSLTCTSTIRGYTRLTHFLSPFYQKSMNASETLWFAETMQHAQTPLVHTIVLVVLDSKRQPLKRLHALVRKLAVSLYVDFLMHLSLKKIRVSENGSPDEHSTLCHFCTLKVPIDAREVSLHTDYVLNDAIRELIFKSLFFDKKSQGFVRQLFGVKISPNVSFNPWKVLFGTFLMSKWQLRGVKLQFDTLRCSSGDPFLTPKFFSVKFVQAQYRSVTGLIQIYSSYNNSSSNITYFQCSLNLLTGNII